MKNKLNYKELISEISGEVSEGILSEKDTVQLLRDETPIFENYCPIIDWYYDEFIMSEELDTPLEEMYLAEEFSSEEWDQMKIERETYKQQYESDQPKLENMTVKEALTEMKQIQKLFK